MQLGTYPSDSEYDMADDEDLNWEVIGTDYSLIRQNANWYPQVNDAFEKNANQLRKWYNKLTFGTFSCQTVYGILFDLLSTDQSVVNRCVLQIFQDSELRDSFTTVKKFMEATVAVDPETEATIGQNMLGIFEKTEMIPVGALIVCLYGPSPSGGSVPWRVEEARQALNTGYNRLIRQSRYLLEDMKNGKSGRLQLRRKVYHQRQRTAKKYSRPLYRRCCAACAARLKLQMRPRLVCRACTYL